MTDSHQAIYDAVRSKISNGDIGNAVESAISNIGIGHYVMTAMENIKIAAASYETPSAIYRPKIFPDGDMWCALYGENLQEGVVGFGKSPYLAAENFDKNWYAKMEQPNV